MAYKNKKIFPRFSSDLRGFLLGRPAHGSRRCRAITRVIEGSDTYFKYGGFELRKWLSNKIDIVSQFQFDSNINSSILQLGFNESNKTLGIYWNSNQDTINIPLEFPEKMFITVILSTDQIFDPLDIFGPNQ